ncbi:hypothetical protein [Winogradskyella sp.]|nr:hypothetical protein [Winogradskyella sp.]
MALSLLISILFQIGIINSLADFDEAKTDKYINQIESIEGVIQDDPTVF